MKSRYPGGQALYDQLFAAEDHHFWFQARNTIVAAAVERATRLLPKAYRILEIGCGTGNVLRVLENNAGSSNVIGIDLFSGGFRYARQRTRCSLVQADMYLPPFNISFDVVAMFDVIEHLADDVAALCQAHKLLKTGGKLLITVPAHMNLWSYADDFAGHYRRYERTDLSRLLGTAGFTIDYVTQFMALLLPFIWVKRRLLMHIRGKDRTKEAGELFASELRPVPILNDILRWILEKEATFVRLGLRLNFGTSLLAIASKQ